MFTAEQSSPSIKAVKVMALGFQGTWGDVVPLGRRLCLQGAVSWYGGHRWHSEAPRFRAEKDRVASGGRHMG